MSTRTLIRLGIIISIGMIFWEVNKKEEAFKNRDQYEEVLEELRLIVSEGLPKSANSFWLSASPKTDHGIVEDYYFAAAELRRRDPSIRLPEFYHQLIEGLRYHYVPASSKGGEIVER